MHGVQISRETGFPYVVYSVKNLRSALYQFWSHRLMVRTIDSQSINQSSTLCAITTGLEKILEYARYQTCVLAASVFSRLVAL